MQSLLSTWPLTIFYTQMSVWHEECSRHDSAEHFQAGQIGLRYQLLSMGRLISLAECRGLCSQRRVVVLNTIYCRGQRICCCFRYLSYFLSFVRGELILALLFARRCLPRACCEGSVQLTVDLVACAITSGFPESRVICAPVWQGVRASGQQF